MRIDGAAGLTALPFQYASVPVSPEYGLETGWLETQQVHGGSRSVQNLSEK